MKKKLLVALLCLTLVCCFTACNLADFEFGGLVGELFSQGVGDYIPSDDHIMPETAIKETWVEETWIEETWVEDETVSYPMHLYAGYTLTLLGSMEHDLGFDEYGDDIVAETSYRRNMSLTEQYSIAVDALLADQASLGDMVRNDVTAGQGDYDVVMGVIADPGAELAQKGMLYNLYGLSYVDIKGEGWDASNHEGLAIGSYLPMATGSLVPTSDLYTSMLVFNAVMMDEMGINPYDYVQCGGWTLSKMNTFAAMAYSDLNGNGYTDQDDALGLVATLDSANAFAVAADAVLIEKDASTNAPFLNSLTEEQVTAYGLVFGLINENKGSYGVYGYASDAQTAFEMGNTLLYTTTVQGAMQLMGSDVAYGILPYPKLSENQVDYRSYVDCYSTAVMIPVSAQRIDFVGYALNALTYSASGLLESTVGPRICRSEQDAEMLTLVLDSKTLDFGSNYLYANTEGAVQLFRMAIAQTSVDNLASLMARNEKVIQKGLKKLISSYEDLQ